MAFELKQHLKLSQQLIMTPQLQQAIKLLQLSRLELVEAVNQEMEENPLLEEAAAEEETEISTDVEPAEVQTPPETKRTEELTGEGDGKEEFDWSGYLEDYSPSLSARDRSDADAPSWENLLVVKSTLNDYLMWQLGLSSMTDLERRIGEQIIGNIDPNGYLAASVEEIAVLESVAPAVVECVLKSIQEFDPPGIAARDLKECLLIQSRILRMQGTLVDRIIEHHIKDLEIKNYANIARKLKVPLQEVLAAVEVIGNMDPKPGSSYNDDRVQTIIPDVYVVKSGDDYKVTLNDDGMPRLRISGFYRNLVGGGSPGANAETGKKYIRERMQSAAWLIKSIQQRQRTIYKVAESIVQFQRSFLDNGISHLKPLVLRDVAENVGMHESTISRVVTNKYMHTPQGIYEMKFFFSSSLKNADGEAIASKCVKEEIRKIVGSEGHKKPYSDSDIVAMLAKSGTYIARRTVAKYREMMGILPSSRRKKMF